MEINFSKESEFLNIELKENFEYDSFVDFLKSLGAEDSKKVLINASRLQNTNLNYEVRYNIIIVAKEYLNKSAKFAIVWPAQDINDFIIDNLRNRNINIQIFSKTVKAKRWLLKKE